MIPPIGNIHPTAFPNLRGLPAINNLPLNQLQAMYSLQFCLLSNSKLKNSPIISGSKSIQPNSSKPFGLIESVETKKECENLKSSFSIDDILQRSVSTPQTRRTTPQFIRTPETVDYTVEDLQYSDGRCKKRQASPESMDNSVTGIYQERHICSECGKGYATSSNLSRHKQTHRPLDSPHAKRCPYCERVYVSMPALSMHLLTHQASHKCPVCEKVFSRPWLLKGHMRSHTGQKPFGCAHCGKAFADRSNLRAHMHTHTGVKKHACKSCGKLFALKSYLNKHMETACLRKIHSDTSLNNEELISVT
uniref:C2H2-type domain-containing protein n=2 Tax=Acrobeloides nanus TaxID=290746 RepID=A0A914DIQ7_9BILA